MPTRLDKHVLEQIIKATPSQVEDALDAGAFEGQRIVVQSFGTSPPGRAYRHGSVTHIASQAGYPPNVDVGALSNAINVSRPRRLTRSINTGSVGYAVHLEFGTRKMGKRPFMMPMMMTLKGMLPGIIAGALKL